MQVARLYDFGDIRVEESARPEVGPTDILIRASACGICSGDIMPWYIKRKAPLVLGHEPVGTVEQAGAEVRGFKRGDRVFVHHHAPCFQCSPCRRGEYVQCQTWRATNINPGGMSEFFLVSAANQLDTLPLPDSVADADGVLIEPPACVVKSLRRSGLKAGETILIIGLGIMGMMHVKLARHLGAGMIIGADLFHTRANRAVELGADRGIVVAGDNMISQVREITKGAMADVVIVGPGTAKAINCPIHRDPARRRADAQAARSLFQRNAPGPELLMRPRRNPRGLIPGATRRNQRRRPGDASFPAGANHRSIRNRTKARIAKSDRHLFKLIFCAQAQGETILSNSHKRKCRELSNQLAAEGAKSNEGDCVCSRPRCYQA